MREGPLSELFRNTEALAPVEREPPAWGTESRPPVPDQSGYMAVIKVVGIGGAGCNAINRMIQAGVRGVEFVAVNTDRQSLDSSQADVRIPVGLELTRGRGTGGDTSKGEQALRESEEQIRRALRGSDLVFIAVGEGGGTGTGGAPVVAKLARELGALTIAVVTRPFSFEGSRRLAAAEKGIEGLKDLADTIIVIPNDRLMGIMDRSTRMTDAFEVCDDLLRQGVQGITDLITLPGMINLDFADVRTVIRGAGSALLGIGFASGGTRARDAAQAAISSPLLETPIDGARGILLGITGGPDLSLLEVNEAARIVSDAADSEANIIFGATIDPELKDQIWITVVAASFSGRRAAPRLQAAPAPAPTPPVAEPAPPEGAAPGIEDPPEAPDLSAGAAPAPQTDETTVFPAVDPAPRSEGDDG